MVVISGLSRSSNSYALTIRPGIWFALILKRLSGPRASRPPTYGRREQGDLRLAYAGRAGRPRSQTIAWIFTSIRTSKWYFLTYVCRRHTVEVPQRPLIISGTTSQGPRFLADRQRRAMEKDSRDRTVLIVEDSDDARYFMRLALEQLGYLVVEAENGAVALEVAERERPDIILMDLSLPVMDGMAATEKIPSHPGWQKIPLVGLSAPPGPDFPAGAQGTP